MLKLASVFTDHAVLQRNKMIPVWGFTEPETFVEVKLNGETSWAKSVNGGKFMTYLPPMQAGGPYKMTVTAGDEVIELNDIMIGEVWLASGQSNMQYCLGSDWTHMQSTKDGTNAAQLKEFIETRKNMKAFRMFTVPMIVTATEEHFVNAVWQDATPENIPAFSAVAAWFAKYVQEGLDEDIPVGILACSWGGSIAETWISTAALLQEPLTRNMAKEHLIAYSQKPNLDGSAQARSMEEVLCDILDIDDLYAENKGEKDGWAEIYMDDSSWKDYEIPGSWFVQKLFQNGIIWVRIPVTVPADWAGKDLVLNLGAIDKTDITYFNGEKVGETGGKLDVGAWNVFRSYKIPASLVKPGERNMIAVRVISFAYDGSFHSMKEQLTLECPEVKGSIPLAGVYKSSCEKNIGKIVPPNGTQALDLNNKNVYGALFDSMIHPLIPYALRGAIWYQGESNASSTYYDKVMEMLIRDWRYHFQQDDFPFIQVQLANYTEPCSCNPHDNWAQLREQQQRICKTMKNVFMITAIDLGDDYDIHPQDKKTVGRRLADNALCNVYGRNGYCPSGPVFSHAWKEGYSVRVMFEHAEGLMFPDGEPKGLGFFIAGSNRRFVPVDEVVIDGNSLVLSNHEVSSPRYVWYSWSANPDGNLKNKYGLPAHPFRVDLEGLD